MAEKGYTCNCPHGFGEHCQGRPTTGYGEVGGKKGEGGSGV